MIITATEFEENFDKYMELVEEENIEITIIKNGMSIVKLTPVKEDKLETEYSHQKHP